MSDPVARDPISQPVPMPLVGEQRMRFAAVEICHACHRWVVAPNGAAIEPFLPIPLHTYPQLLGG